MSSKTKTTATKKNAMLALVPKLRFPEFRDAEGWASEPMGEVYSFKGNNSLSRDKLNYVAGSLKNIHYGDIHTKFTSHFDITKELVPFINESEEGIVRDENLCAEGDMVFADASEDMADIGKSIEIVNLNGERVASGLHTVLARRIRDRIALGFGGHLFKSGWVRTQIQKEAQGAKVLGISANRMRNLRLPLPHAEAEQQKIAECLSSVDELIAAQARKLDALKTHKKGLMQQLFPCEGETQPRLRFPEFHNAGEWVSRTGTEITTKITKGSSPNWQGFSYQTQGVLFVTSENVRDGFLDVSEPKFLPEEFFAKQSNSHLLYGDILINIVGASIGRNCVYRLKEPAFTNQAVALFRVTKKYSFEFVSYCYQQDRSQKAVSASQSDSARPNLSLADLRSMEFFIPSLPEQQRIADCLTSLDDLIAAQTQKYEALKTHKKGLMQQLFPSPEEQNTL